MAAHIASSTMRALPVEQMPIQHRMLEHRHGRDRIRQIGTSDPSIVHLC